ncbi:outer membrane beta-barrel protein [Ekhidna sp.]|uniref:outer membrane beta-barrel protein n=1 Tax=Ekhidna sp. TaxID=2608089 RepID=UPI003299AB2E
MKAILTLSLSLITCALFGQISFYGGGNMTVIPTLVETYMPPINVGTGFSTTGPGYGLEESYDSRVGFQFGLRYTRNITSKINLTGGLGFSSIRFKRDNSLTYDEPSVFTTGYAVLPGNTVNGSPLILRTNTPNTVGSGENVGSTSLNYIEIPISITYDIIPKFFIGVGVTNALLVRSKEVVNSVEFTSTFDRGEVVITPGDNTTVSAEDYFNQIGSYVIVEVDDTSREGISTYSLMGSLTLGYKLMDQLSIISAFNQGINAIYGSEKQIAGKAKRRSVSLGVQYRLK